MENGKYDDIDMRNAYNHGYWQGAVLGGIGMLVLLLGVGYFLI